MADWVRPTSASVKVRKKLTGKNWTHATGEHTAQKRNVRCQCEPDVSQTLQSKPIGEIDKPLFRVLRKKKKKNLENILGPRFIRERMKPQKLAYL